MDDYDKNKIIVLYDSITYFRQNFKKKGVSVCDSFKKVNKVGKVFRKFSEFTTIGRNYWFGNWKNKLEHINTVIVFAENRIDHLIYIKKKYPKIRIILWYWNPVFRCIHPDKIPEGLCEKWSFDFDDCKKYNLHYNNQFYFDNIELDKKQLIYDGFFLGNNKGRRNYLNDIKCIFTDNKLVSSFYIIPDEGESNVEQFIPISYEDYLNRFVSSTKGLIDVQPTGQSGLTLRPLEAIFFKKKLITNDKKIKNYDFYHSSNIYILGIDDNKSLVDFMNKKYENINTEIIKKYDVSNWLNNFYLK
ncbi:hypothetical protein [Chryseobacterium sp. JAH]|uniref:hypothetical protein n=1 Tax=Chryseobacterium sp. JAH TaxID=1742858 RepID=UPI000740DD86|nr:hypothetical protein [Chryseobacterium sp. JAH]KUJ50595.1 hypothetical protein AR685_14980 [Chryseobacterium sp. JAH]